MIDDIAFLDDATRPVAPKLAGLTPEQKAPGEHLRMIHDHLRGNMKSLRVLIERASVGAASPAEVADMTADLAMVANYRRFGNLCGQHCAIVEQHHSIEDYSVFPPISAKSAAWKKVTDRLAAEHVIVHELLVRLMDAIATLAASPDRDSFDTAKELYETLERVLLSHLGYEEEQIGDALGYFRII